MTKKKAEISTARQTEDKPVPEYGIDAVADNSSSQKTKCRQEKPGDQQPPWFIVIESPAKPGNRTEKNQQPLNGTYVVDATDEVCNTRLPENRTHTKQELYWYPDKSEVKSDGPEKVLTRTQTGDKPAASKTNQELQRVKTDVITLVRQQSTPQDEETTDVPDKQSFPDLPKLGKASLVAPSHVRDKRGRRSGRKSHNYEKQFKTRHSKNFSSPPNASSQSQKNKREDTSSVQTITTAPDSLAARKSRLREIQSAQAKTEKARKKSSFASDSEAGCPGRLTYAKQQELLRQYECSGSESESSSDQENEDILQLYKKMKLRIPLT